MKLLALQFTMLFSRKLLNEEEVYCVFPQIQLSLVLLHRRDPLPWEAPGRARLWGKHRWWRHRGCPVHPCSLCALTYRTHWCCRPELEQWEECRNHICKCRNHTRKTSFYMLQTNRVWELEQKWNPMISIVWYSVGDKPGARTCYRIGLVVLHVWTGRNMYYVTAIYFSMVTVPLDEFRLWR